MDKKKLPYARDKTARAVDLFPFLLVAIWEGGIFKKAVYLVNLLADHLAGEKRTLYFGGIFF